MNELRRFNSIPVELPENSVAYFFFFETEDVAQWKTLRCCWRSFLEGEEDEEEK